MLVGELNIRQLIPIKQLMSLRAPLAKVQVHNLEKGRRKLEDCFSDNKRKNINLLLSHLFINRCSVQHIFIHVKEVEYPDQLAKGRVPLVSSLNSVKNFKMFYIWTGLQYI